MNHRSTDAARFALKGVAFAAACLWGAQSWALGLGRLTVTSALGETLRAEIEVTSMTPEEASSLRLRVAPPEAYRAAGVEYNAALPSAVVQVVKRDRVETRRVETGLMAAGQVEIREGIAEGDIVVARAGALLREGDPVRPVMTSADVK